MDIIPQMEDLNSVQIESIRAWPQIALRMDTRVVGRTLLRNGMRSSFDANPFKMASEYMPGNAPLDHMQKGLLLLSYPETPWWHQWCVISIFVGLETPFCSFYPATKGCFSFTNSKAAGCWGELFQSN